MKIEFDLSAKLAENCLVLSGNSAHDIEIQATDTISPALAVWQKWEQLKPPHGDKLTIQGPDGFRSSFHYQIAVFIARALIVLQNNCATKDKIGHSDKPLDKHLPAIRGVGFPDSALFGHGLAQLASYAQAEWTGAYIPCPLEKRLCSLFIALHRTCNDEVSLYGKVQASLTDAIASLDNERPLGMVAMLFQCSLAACSVKKQYDQAIIQALGDLNGAAAAHPSSPRIEGIFDNDDKDGFKLSNHWWLKSLVERLKLDRDAYKRDAARAKKDYSVLAGVQKEIVPVETIRIERPESLLFDLWAWQDYESSKEHSGFPLAWIDNGWYTQGFELRLDPSRRTLIKPLEKQVDGLSLPTPKQTGNAGWSLTYANDPSNKSRSDVRYGLKRKLFTRNASFKVEDIPCHVTNGSTELRSEPAFLELAIRDSEVGNPKKQLPSKLKLNNPDRHSYLWAEVEFANVNIYETWAGDEVATILYSLLRRAPQMTLPNDFLAHHVHRYPGMVCAWAREGMVVAHQSDDESKNAVRELREEVQTAAKLEGELESLIGSAGESELPREASREDRVKDIVKKHLVLRQSLAEPNLRPLRGFLERRHAQEIYDAFRQSEADANQLHTLETMKESSERLDWLEAVLFAFAITEAGHVLGEAVLPDHWVWITILASFVGFLGAYLFLFNSRKERPETLRAKSGKLILLAVFAIIYGGAFVFWFNHHAGRDQESKPPSPPVCQVCCSPAQPPMPPQPITAPALRPAKP